MAHNNTIGVFGEKLAILYLRRKGYKILRRNMRVGNKEIDILAKIKDKIVFIEVKTRLKTAANEDQEVLSQRKIFNLRSALNTYLSGREQELAFARVDLLLIELDRSKNIANIKHFHDII